MQDSTDNPTEEAEVPASSRLYRLGEWIARAGGAIGCLLIVAILLLTAVSVFERYVRGVPLRGADEATGFLVVGIVMFGAAEALRRNDHIRIDLITNLVSDRIRWMLDIWSYLCVLVFACFFLFTAWRTVKFSYRFQDYSTGYLEMPMWIPESAMLAGAFLLGLVAILKIARLISHGAPR